MSRRRRMVLTALAVVGLIVAAGGIWYWDATRFPAPDQRVTGTPFTLKIQDGRGAREVALFRRGLVAEQAFLGTRIGRAIVGPVEARLAHGDPCEPFQAPGEGATGVEREDFVCIDSLVPIWQRNAREHPEADSAAAAHELVHRWQRELGCGAREGGYRWLLEGNATDFAWRALEQAGNTSEAATVRGIRRFGAFDARVGPLRRYETAGGADAEYALWHVAVRDLLRRAPAGPVAMRHFCEAVGRGSSSRAAFAGAFGLPVERFYAAFEAARPAYRRGSRSL